MRSAVGQAQNAEKTAANTGTQLGTEAQGIGSTLTPFLTSELTHPQGYSQQDQSAMLAAGQAGAGGADAGIVGQANQEAARTHNAGSFQTALDDAARQRMKASALSSEQVAGQNAGLKVQEQQDAARGLQGMYGTDTSGMLDAMGQESRDIGAESQANNTGWLQNMNNTIAAITGAARAYKPGGFGG